MDKVITIEETIKAPIEMVWNKYSDPAAVKRWNQASDDWHCPEATNKFWEGGSFAYTMAARDGSQSFVFNGIYDKIEKNKTIEYTIGDGRKAKVDFDDLEDKLTRVTVNFEAEGTNPEELQKSGWLAILQNFKKFCEKESE